MQIRARVRDLVFNPLLCNGVGDHMTGRKIDDRWYSSIGSGRGEDIFGSQLFLYVSVGRKIVRAWMNRRFKEKLFGLNPCVAARRVILEETMPRYVSVLRKKTDGNTTYYAIEDKDLDEWLERISSLASVN